MPDFRDLWVAVVGGLSSAIFTGGPLTAIFLYYRTRTDNSLAKLATDLASLREEKVRRIETSLESHLREDRSQQILTQGRGLSAKIELMSNKLDAVREETAEQRAEIKNVYSFVRDVDGELKQHLRES